MKIFSIQLEIKKLFLNQITNEEKNVQSEKNSINFFHFYLKICLKNGLLCSR